MNKFRTFLTLSCGLFFSSVAVAQGNRHGGSWENDYLVTTFVNAAIPFGTNDGDILGLGDLDFDGVPDFAIASDSGLALFSGLSGNSLWMVHFDLDYGLASWSTKLHRVHDWDGDGIDDLMINDHRCSELFPGTRGGGAVMVISTMTGDLLWVSFGSDWSVGGFAWDADSVPDQNGDRIPDLVVAVENSGINSSAMFFLSGVDGSMIWRRDMSLPPEGAGLNALEFMEGLDGDQDGQDDLLVYFMDTSAPYHPKLMSMRTGAFLYEVVPPVMISWRDIGDAVVIPDQDGDGIAEFALRAGYNTSQLYPDGGVTCVSGADGTEIWTAVGQKPIESLGHEITVLGDWNADGYPDLAASAPGAQVAQWQYAGQIRLIDGKTGKFIGRILGGAENSNLAFLGLSLDRGPQTDGLLLAFERGNLLGLPDGRVRYLNFHPFLTSPTETLSAAVGAQFDLSLDLPDRFGDRDYALLLSRSGYGPTTIQGIKIPLSADSLFQRTRSGSHFSFFAQPYGQLDSDGDAVISVQIPAGALGTLVGTTLYAAAVAGDIAAATLETSSVVVPFEITP